ncbi:DUF4232 domain-containing protein [Streptomyces sp. AC555_RSS877]|uniref:DUF4232 domain-containing protein n=1 Tax=Streptomyces sp. AC555_RSS877 TaxID=2823688 RepID=UPI001C26CBAF|nr:DUF4232 domain-containing protein [Streptomyces sp. AC555_RSS877]
MRSSLRCPGTGTAVHRRVAHFLVVTAAATALAGCGTGDANTVQPPIVETATKAVTGGGTGSGGAAGAAPAEPTRAAARDSDTTSSGTGTGTGTDADADADGGRCHTTDLSIELPDDDTLPADISVTISNTGQRTCTMGGFPGVDLQGDGLTHAFRRGDTSGRRVTLSPGDSTHFTLRPVGAGGEFSPETIVITPPDETEHQTLPWPWGAVRLAENTAYAGTVEPVGA